MATNAIKTTNPGWQAGAPKAKQAQSGNYTATTINDLTNGQGPATYNAANAKAASYKADERSVGKNSTVKYQMEGLLSQGSKYLDLARNKAAQTANARGLINSSMAAGAGERAAIEAALPIASQDASTYNNQSLTNQAASNQARQFNAGNKQQMSLANMNAKNQAGQFNANTRNQAYQFDANNRNQAGMFNAESQQQASQFNASQANNMLQNQWSQLSAQSHAQVMKNLDTQSRQQLIDFEKKWDRVLEQDKNANVAYSTAMQSLGTAMSNGELSPEQQKEAAKQITDQLNAYMSFTQKITGGGEVDSPEQADKRRKDAIDEQKAQREREAQRAEELERIRKREEEIARREEELARREQQNQRRNNDQYYGGR